MTLSAHIEERIARCRPTLNRLIELEGIANANAFAVILLFDEIPDIARAFDTEEGTVHQTIGKVTKNLLGAMPDKKGNQGPGFVFTSLRR